MAVFNPSFSAQGGSLPYEISQGLIFNAKALGSIQEDLNSECLQDNSSSSVIDKFKKLSDLAREIDSVNLNLKSISAASWNGEFQYVSGLARGILAQQFDSLQQKSFELKQAVEWKLSACIPREYSNKAEEELKGFISCYLTKRDPHFLRTVRAEYEKYEVLRGDYIHAKISSSKFEDPERKSLISLLKLARLIQMSQMNEPIEFAVQELESAIAEAAAKGLISSDNGGIQLEDSRKKSIDKSIEWIDQQLGSKKVDGLVWSLAGKKSGENWGFVHRYDDLNILKEAILKASEILVEKIFNEEGAGLDRDLILTQCYENLGSPVLPNWKEWMCANISHYPQTLKKVIAEIKFQEGGFKTLNPYNFHILLGYYVPKLTEITYMLNHLEDAAEKDNGITDEYKKYIESFIDRIPDQKQTIDYEVWRLSQAQDKSGENWGEVHRFDDLKVLRQALMVAFQKDFDNWLVNEKLKDPADQNAFYTEIGRLHYTFFHLDSSNPNFIKLGKENIALWLHMYQQVLEKINTQRAEAESKIIDLAMSKNPDVASSCVDLFFKIRDYDPDDVEPLSAKIREIVEGRHFNDGIRQKIFLETWILAGKPQGNPRFGQENYLTDLSRLDRVLFKILEEISLA